MEVRSKGYPIIELRIMNDTETERSAVAAPPWAPATSPRGRQ